jgi:tetratricopeptide (TPR) repeat protein/tRNA A-37 threonylcarbamoyl transferase component Bud32
MNPSSRFDTASLSVSAELHIDRLCDQFEDAWKAGRPARIEEYLDQVGEAVRPFLLPELLAIEIDYRRQAGDTLCFDDYLRRFPELDPDTLSAFLEEESAALLAVDASTFDPASTPPPVGRQAKAGEHAVTPPVGRLGDYELLQEIARGGMGIVYKARQVSLNRLVAVKVILSGELASEKERQRFQVEAEAAAGLDHPNIVPVYEIGESAGRRFFAMKLIEGTSLARAVKDGRWADGTMPSQQSVARLAAAVARAVHYAHQRGVLHRDIKPSNILLDQGGQPQVVDFGLAKRVESTASLTGTDALLGTPAYLAPEVAGGSGRNYTTAVDIYGLGAVLYEMLTGHPPFRGPSAMDILRQVTDEEPVPPRKTNPAIARDLEIICLKCLHKEPKSRYGTAEELAEDLERFVRGEAILARPSTAWERGWRWCRRNRGPVLAASLLFLALSLGLVGTSLALAWALEAEAQARADRDDKDNALQLEAKQRERAVEAEGNAVERQADMEAFAKFLVEQVLAAARPEDFEGGVGVDATIKEAIDAAVPKIAEIFAGRPLAELRVRSAIGSTYYWLGEYQASIVQDKLALDLARNWLGPYHEDTLEIVHSLGLAHLEAEQLQIALPLLEENLRLIRVHLGPKHRTTPVAINGLAMAYREAGRLQDALPLFEESLRLRTEALGPSHPETLTAMNNLADTYRQAGRLNEAVPLLEETWRRRADTLGATHPRTLTTQANLALAYKGVRRLQDALVLRLDSLEGMKEKLGLCHPITITNLVNLADLYWALNRAAEVVPYLEEARAATTDKLGLAHADTLRIMELLASTYGRAGKRDQAIALGQETLRLREEHLGPMHPDTITSMNNLAFDYRAAGRLNDALRLYEETLSRVKAAHGPSHPHTMITTYALGLLHLQLRHYARAEELLLICQSGIDQNLPGLHPNIRRGATLALVRLYEDWGKLDEAEKARAKLPPAARIRDGIERQHAWPLLWGLPRL